MAARRYGLLGTDAKREYLLVIIDEYSRYPELEFVRSTSAQAVIPHLDRVFSTYGFPEMVKTDGGPPFNGHEYHQYMKWAGIHAVVVSPEDPEANGLAENFMKAMKKVWQIANIEKKSHKQELYKFLRHYRATPHSSTEKAPAEVLFNRKFQVRLPQKNDSTPDPMIVQKNLRAKAQQKAYKDAKANVKPHNIKVGDSVLLLQKQSKTKPRYDPQPYTVTDVQETQVIAARGTTIRKRDAQRFKVITQPVQRRYGTGRYPLDLRHDATTTFDWTPPTEVNQHQPDNIQPPPRHQYPNGHLEPNINPNLPRNLRNRHPPQRYIPEDGRWTQRLKKTNNKSSIVTV